MIRHGHRIESGELAARFAASEARVRELERALEDAYQRIESAELCILAASPALPPDEPARGGRAPQLMLRVSPGVGTELVGPAVVTARSSSRAALTFDPATTIGTGELLLPGQLWGRLSTERVETFEARIDPAYLTSYNELLLPFVAGESYALRLHHSRGFDTYGGITRTRLLRFDRPREWNGHLTITSTASYALGSYYVHAGAAPFVLLSSWALEGELRASRTIEAGGVYTFHGAFAEPGHVPLAGVRYYANGTETTGPVALEAGDALELYGTAAWDAPATHVSLSYSLS